MTDLTIEAEHLLPLTADPRNARRLCIFVSWYSWVNDQWKWDILVVLRRQNSVRRNVICVQNPLPNICRFTRKYFIIHLQNRFVSLCVYYNHHENRFVSLKRQQIVQILHLSDVNFDSKWPTPITRWEIIVDFCNYLTANGAYYGV